MKGGILYMKNIKEMEKIEIDNKTPIYTIICNLFTFNDIHFIDYEWIQRQMDYINNLSDRQKHIIRTYTIYSDKLINKYLRNTLKPKDIEIILSITLQQNENPFKYQHFDKTGRYEYDKEYKKNCIEYIKEYVKEFSDIIKQSPRLIKPIKVFRGITNDKYLLNGMKENNNGNKLFKNIEFISTSMYLESATKFIKNKCCLLELVLNISVPCLFTALRRSQRCGIEYEITLAPNTVMTDIIQKNKLLLNEPEHYNSSNIFTQTIKYKLDMSRVYESIVTY
jgi:hypothetical protein